MASAEKNVIISQKLFTVSPVKIPEEQNFNEITDHRAIEYTGR